MSSMDFILSGFASITQLLTMKPKNFPTKTPKAHLVGCKFIFYSFKTWNDSTRWSMWSSTLTDLTNMSSMYTSMDALICFWNILFTNL